MLCRVRGVVGESLKAARSTSISWSCSLSRDVRTDVEAWEWLLGEWPGESRDRRDMIASEDRELKRDAKARAPGKPLLWPREEIMRGGVWMVWYLFELDMKVASGGAGGDVDGGKNVSWEAGTRSMVGTKGLSRRDSVLSPACRSGALPIDDGGESG